MDNSFTSGDKHAIKFSNENYMGVVASGSSYGKAYTYVTRGTSEEFRLVRKSGDTVYLQNVVTGLYLNLVSTGVPGIMLVNTTLTRDINAEFTLYPV